MRRSLRETQPAFSLFAFQDIIFSVTAVLLFATIWFALSTRVRHFARGPDDTAAQLLAEEIDRLSLLEMHRELPMGTPMARVDARWADFRAKEGGLPPASENERRQTQDHELRAAAAVRRFQVEAERSEEIRRAIAKAELRAAQILVRQSAAMAGRELVVMVVGGGEVTVEDARGELTRSATARGRVTEVCRDLLAGRDPDHDYLFVGLRPSAASAWAPLLLQLEQTGMPFTLEPVEEAQIVQRHTEGRARALLAEVR